jgi:hypothetical protein
VRQLRRLQGSERRERERERGGKGGGEKERRGEREGGEVERERTRTQRSLSSGEEERMMYSRLLTMIRNTAEEEGSLLILHSADWTGGFRCSLGDLERVLTCGFFAATASWFSFPFLGSVPFEAFRVSG